MKNDGINDIEYSFGDDEELNTRLSYILNEACHVFRYHADGKWKTVYKDRYSGMLAKEIAKKPSLIKKLLGLEDRVVSNITYRAIELNKKDSET